MSDLYNILGVERTAEPDEIKRAYRKLAAQHHPDRGGDTKKFQEIQAAYDTLSDPEKRAAYDNPQPQGFPGGFHFHGSGFPPGFEEIFSQFGDPFGGMFRRGGGHPQRNRNLNVQVTITLDEAFSGKNLIANLTLPSGKEQLIDVKIPAGIADGITLRLSGLGDDSITQIPRGDLHLTVNIAPHPEFQRQGDDLVKILNVNCIDAILGKTYIIETIDKKTLEFNLAPGTQQGQIFSIPSYGMPNVRDSRFRGRLLVSIQTFIPTDLTESQKDLLRQITT